MNKIWIIVILCCLLSFLGLSACENEKESDITENIGNTNISGENIDNKTSVIVTSGNESENKDKSVDEIILTDDLLENYMEKQVPIDSKYFENTELFAGSVLNVKDVIEYYSVSDEEGETIVWKYILNDDDTWRKEEVTWLNSLKNKIDQKRIFVLLGADGNYYAHYVEKGERSHLVKKEGEGFIEIATPDWDKTKERDYYMIPDKVAVLENGNIVMASRTETCYIYDKDSGEVINTFSCGSFYSLITNGNNIIILDEENQSVLIYDTQQMKVINEIYGNFNPGTVFFVKQDSIYACCNGGILKTELDKDSWQKLLEPGTNQFASNDPYQLFVKNNDFYIIYHSDFERYMKYTERTSKDIVREELTIFSLRDNKEVRDVITEFQLKYPEIKIVFETGEITSAAATVSDSIRALNTKIMNGEGPDIFLLEGLPVDSYIEKDILLNLEEEIQEYKDELHQGILDVFTSSEGSVYMIPLFVSMPVFYTTPKAEQAISSLSSLVELSEDMEEPLVDQMTYDEALDVLYHFYLPDIISSEKEVQNANIEEFLSLVKRFCDSEQISETKEDTYSYHKQNGGVLILTLGKIDLSLTYMDGLIDLWDRLDLLKNVEGKLISNQNYFKPIGLIGISKSSKKQSDALLFLKESLSFGMQNRDATASGFPINKSALEELRKADYSHMTQSYTIDEENRKVISRMFNQEEASQIIDMVNKLDKCCSMDETIIQIIKEEAPAFLNGNSDINQTVGKIRNRIELYIYE